MACLTVEKKKYCVIHSSLVPDMQLRNDCQTNREESGTFLKQLQDNARTNLPNTCGEPLLNKVQVEFYAGQPWELDLDHVVYCSTS